MNSTLGRTIIVRNSTEHPASKLPLLRQYLEESRLIIYISLFGVGLLVNIVNQIVLSRGFSDTIMVRYLKCISIVDATFCAVIIAQKTFAWWNYAPHKWISEIYYYVIFNGSISLEAIASLMYLPLMIDRIRSIRRTADAFPQKYQQNTERRTIFKIIIAVTVIIGVICSLPLFYMFKVERFIMRVVLYTPFSMLNHKLSHCAQLCHCVTLSNTICLRKSTRKHFT